MDKHLKTVQQMKVDCSDREIAILATALRELQISGTNAMTTPVCIQVVPSLVALLAHVSVCDDLVLWLGSQGPELLTADVLQVQPWH